MFSFVILSTVLLTVNGQYRGAARDYKDYDGGSSGGAYIEPQQAYRQSAPSADYTQQYQSPQQPLQPQPAIIMHKQALTHDGGFNYAFAADNGLKQGESIAPDGTRTGAYQYVDPNGKTISVKYTAGKDGFKILEGAHIPKPHPAIAQLSAQKPLPQYQPPQSQYQQQYKPQFQIPQYKASPSAVYSKYNSNAQDEDDGSYRGEAAYTNAGPQTFSPVSQPKYVPQEPISRPVIPQYRATNNAIQRNEEQHDVYSVEPGKPHSFGSGYSFEFGG